MATTHLSITVETSPEGVAEVTVPAGQDVLADAALAAQRMMPEASLTNYWDFTGSRNNPISGTTTYSYMMTTWDGGPEL